MPASVQSTIRRERGSALDADSTLAICRVTIDVEGMPSRAWWTQVMNHSGHGPDVDGGKPARQTDGCIKIVDSIGVNDERTRHLPTSFAIPMTGTTKVSKRLSPQ